MPSGIWDQLHESTSKEADALVTSVLVAQALDRSPSPTLQNMIDTSRVDATAAMVLGWANNQHRKTHVRKFTNKGRQAHSKHSIPHRIRSCRVLRETSRVRQPSSCGFPQRGNRPDFRETGSSSWLRSSSDKRALSQVSQLVEAECSPRTGPMCCLDAYLFKSFTNGTINAQSACHSRNHGRVPYPGNS